MLHLAAIGKIEAFEGPGERAIRQPRVPVSNLLPHGIAERPGLEQRKTLRIVRG